MVQQPLAYLNAEFLESAEARPIRILSEYLEPLRRFKAQNIQDTVVFFGSARVNSRERAERALATLRARGVENADAAYEAELTRSRRAVEWARYYEEARELARMLTTWSVSLGSQNHRFVVTSGGGPGIMEAANRGAADAQGKSIGLNIGLPFEQFPNPYITPELSFEFHYFFMRKFWFAYLAKAVIVFPGGYGTMDELFELLTLVQTRKMRKPMPIVLFGTDYWSKIVDFDALAHHGMISPDDINLMFRTDSVDEAYDWIVLQLAEKALAQPGATL